MMKLQEINKLIESGDFFTAQEQVKHLLEVHPKDLNILELAMNVFEMTNNQGELTKVIDEILIQDPRHYIAMCTQAKQCILKKNKDRALELLEHAISINPKHIYAYTIRGNYYQYYQRYYQRALEDYESVFNSGNVTNEIGLIVMEDVYKCQLQLGNIEAARRGMEFAMDIDPNNPNYAIRLAFLSHLDEPQKRIQVMKEMAEKYPKEDESHRLLANVIQSSGDLDTAKQLLQDGVGSAKEQDKFYQNIAIIDWIQGDIQSCMNAITEAMKCDPINMDYRLFRANIWLLNDQYNEFLADITEVMNQIGENDEIMFLYSDYYIRVDQFDQAASYLDRINMKEMVNPLIHAMKAFCFAKVGRKKECERLLEMKSPVIEPSPQVLPYIFGAYLELNQFNKAEEYLKKIDKESVPASIIHQSFALLYMKQKRFEESRKEIEEAVKLDPSNQHHLIYLEVLVMLKDSEAFHSLMNKVKKDAINEGNDGMIRALEELSKKLNQ